MELAMIPVNLDERTISVGQLVQAMGCLHSVLLDDATFREARRSRSAGRKRVTLLGLAAHAFAAGKATAEVKKSLNAETPDATEEELQAVLDKGKRSAQRMQARRERAGRFVQREQTVSVVEHRTGWKIFAQPDRFEAPLDASGEYLQLTDFKFPPKIRDRHKLTMRMFGLVFLLLLKIHGEERKRIKLVLEAIEEVNTHEEWLDIREASELLEKARDTIAKLEEAGKAKREHGQVVPRRSGNHCFACELRERCKQGGRFIERAQNERQSFRKAA